MHIIGRPGFHQQAKNGGFAHIRRSVALWVALVFAVLNTAAVLPHAHALRDAPLSGKASSSSLPTPDVSANGGDCALCVFLSVTQIAPPALPSVIDPAVTNAVAAPPVPRAVSCCALPLPRSGSRAPPVAPRH